MNLLCFVVKKGSGSRSSGVGKGVGLSLRSGRPKVENRKNSIGHMIKVTSTR